MKKKRGGGILSNTYDFLLGHPTSFTPLWSTGTTSGAVADSNILFTNRGYVNGAPYSQPINYKYSQYNLPMV